MEGGERTTGAPESARPIRWGRLLLLPVLVLILLGGALRLTGLDDLGLNGSDNTYYTSMARIWSHGERVYSIGGGPDLYHRPVVFWVYGAAVRVLGYNDTSIKELNAALDIGNIILVFCLVFMLARKNLWASSAAAVIYALLPLPILISRSELTHTLSTATLLVSFILLVASWDVRRTSIRVSLAALAGCAVGLSALTHEEMIFASIGPAVFLVVRPGGSRGPGVRSHLIAAAGHAGSYVVGVLATTFGMIQAHHAEAQGRATTIIRHRIDNSYYLRFVERPLKYAWNAVDGSSSTIVASLVTVLALVLIGLCIYHWVRTRPRPGLPKPPLEDLPLWTVVVFLLTFSVFFTYYAARLFLPLLPLVITWLVVRSTDLGRRIGGSWASRAVPIVLTAVAVITSYGQIVTVQDLMGSYFGYWAPPTVSDDLDPIAGWQAFERLRLRKSWARHRWEELGASVNEDARLLVGASTFHPVPGRRLLQIGYYFGDNAVYLFDHDQPLDELIAEKRIGFVFFTTYQNDADTIRQWGACHRYLYDGRWTALTPLTLGEPLGIPIEEYSVKREFEALRARMADRGARIILGERDLMERRPTCRDPFSYVVWVLDPKDWAPLELETDIGRRFSTLAGTGDVSRALAMLDAEDLGSIDPRGRFRLQLTAALELAKHDLPGMARERLAWAMELLPRSTEVATVLRDAYPTRSSTLEVHDLFADLQATKPAHRPTRDLVLALSLNLADFAIESGSTAATLDAFSTMEHQLELSGTRKFTLAVADWCTATSRDLSRDGRDTEARSAAIVAATARRHLE